MACEGHCLCGETAYEFDVLGDHQSSGYCHCRECRRQYGHHAALTGVDDENFRWIKQDHLKWFQSSEFSKRAFCSCCGTPMVFRDVRQDTNFVSVGTINDDSLIKPESHNFLREKGGYYEVKDGLEHNQGDPWIEKQEIKNEKYTP